ncbi:MAG: hypothetical protein U1E39_01900 [Planctomycetota bacterium]
MPSSTTTTSPSDRSPATSEASGLNRGPWPMKALLTAVRTLVSGSTSISVRKPIERTCPFDARRSVRAAYTAGPEPKPAVATGARSPVTRSTENTP